MQRRLARRSWMLHSKRHLLSFELLETRLNLALDVPAFSSLPDANHTIYLDFDGHVTTGTSWNSGATINSPAYSSDADAANFSPSELSVIERTFYRVAEDFAPFQVNVTTVAPSVEDLRNTGGADTKWGVRVVVTRDVAFNCGCGGIAYIDSFDWNSDTPVFVFNTSEIGVAEAVSHEVGHSLGLSHDGTSSVSYYQGHGLGTDSTYWSTIMGVGYYVDVSQWDRGEYTGSNNGSSTANYNKGPDDLQVITNFNGFGFKADDHGNEATTASSLATTGTTVAASGLISTRTDIDYFSFVTSGGSVTLNVNPAAVGANLDIEASLYDSTGALVALSNPLQALNASITTVVASGQYFLKIDGVGAGNPTAATPTGYSDYGSIGAYTISGTVGAITGDALAIVATDASKNEGTSGSTAFTFTVNRTGDTSGTSTVNYVVTGTGASPANASDFVGGVLPGGSLTFAPGMTSQVITINVQGDSTFESSEGFAVSLSAPSSSTVISAATATGTILNDDTAPAAPTLGITATNANKAEGTSSVSTPFVFTITRSGSLTAASSVRYTVSGTGTTSANNTDFAGGFARNVLVNFPIGVAMVDISINVRADSRTEPNETFRVVLSNASGATISTASATGTIQNDDGAAAARDEENGQSEMIAVADPLWMFVPPEFLSAEELAVPVVTWINGVAYIGDLAHDHNEQDHDHFDHDHDDIASEFEVATNVLLAAPLDFSVQSQHFSSLVRELSPSAESERQMSPLSLSTILVAKGALETPIKWQDFDLLANNSVREQSPSQLFEAIDLAYSDDAEEEWLG
ncbi:MAG: Calx-beta domain-containing protein [Pirellulaceae bacterium]|nr:Calx-beta domain-containing protein [Pirellulaceae bacterium]